MHFPEGHGGLGLHATMQQIVHDELAAALESFTTTSRVNPIGIGMGAPTVLTYAQRAR